MATDVFFSTNPADFTRLEGLYISERNPPGFIRGRDLSVVGMAGRCVRGPATPQTITSAARFVEIFGERDFGSGGPLVGEVWSALLNKPFGAIVVRRVTAAAAVAATLEAETGIDGLGTAVLRIEASSVGEWGNSIEAKVVDASDGVSTHFNLIIRYLGVETTFENLNINGATDDNLAEVVGDDVARLVTLTKLADGRPANFSTITEADWEANDGPVGAVNEDFMALGTTLSAYTTVAGTEGTLAATDYNAGLDDLAVFDGISVVLIPDSSPPTQNTINGNIVTQAAAVSDRIFLTWSGTHGQSVSVEQTTFDADITTRSDRIVWCFNSAKTLDPETGLAIDQAPHVWLASILSQNDVDIHPGSQGTSAQTAGIRELNNEVLTRNDLIALRDKGIATLEKVSNSFLFRSAIVTDLTTGKTEITRRRSADFLQLSAAERLRLFVKEKNVPEVRDQMVSELADFSAGLRDQNRIVERFQIEVDSVNTAAQRAQGIERILWRVKLISHILFLVLETEIGTTVEITENAA